MIMSKTPTLEHVYEGSQSSQGQQSKVFDHQEVWLELRPNGKS